MSAAFRTTLQDYAAEQARSVLGHLVSAKATSGFNTQYLKQIGAWEEEFVLLDDMAKKLTASLPSSKNWSLLLEYPIPRRNKYPDAILLAEDLIFLIEFKFGATSFDASAKWQVEDYALDLRDFHLETAGRTIVPFLVPTAAKTSLDTIPSIAHSLKESVWPVLCVAESELAATIASTFQRAHQADACSIDPVAWDHSSYRPSLSIIEAACELFVGHSVREISHSYADNLTLTTDTVLAAIQSAQRERKRVICFVTGVPGAGKTLAGLNAVHYPAALRSQNRPGVFLSGNGPLVKIVRESLVRNAIKERACPRNQAVREVATFVQNVHAFMKAYTTPGPTERPYENVVIFDEAQRAWDKYQVKKKRGLDSSEPQIMLEIMERCPEWCVIVALVGGGQEIHMGEAGLEEWGRALAATNGQWQVLVSPEALQGGSSLAGHSLFEAGIPENTQVTQVPSLHLSVSVRSFRAQTITNWVNLVLEGRVGLARDELNKAGEFPIVLTRDLERARAWLRGRSRLEHRCGLVASSGSLRNRAYGVEVSSEFRKGIKFNEWFLADSTDIRSSYQLEVAATEFECQGLELDWVGLCWGDDLIWDAESSQWVFRQFRGKAWQMVKRKEKQRYLLNKYRVLLTRAREGMVIWIPPGDEKDLTRPPLQLDATANYLAQAGVPML